MTRRRCTHQPADWTDGQAVLFILGLTMIACALAAVIFTMGMNA